MAHMTKVLKEAIEEVATLPEADQETIGRHLLSHVEKLRRLRVEIDKGIRSLDAGEGRELNIEDFVREKTGRHGG
jgi:hypothetical protein